MSFEEVFAPVEAHNRAVVMHATWGHLAPKPRVKHKGFILFSFGEYGCISPIRCRFKDLDDSPWFFQAMTDFIGDKAKTRGRVYRFEGTVMMCKNGKFKFSGKTSVVRI